MACDDLGFIAHESDDECPEEEIPFKSDSDVLKSLQDIMQYGLMNDENVLTNMKPKLWLPNQVKCNQSLTSFCLNREWKHKWHILEVLNGF